MGNTDAVIRPLSEKCSAMSQSPDSETNRGVLRGQAESIFGGKIFRGRGGGGKNFDDFVDVREAEDAFDHAGGTGETEHTAGFFQAGMGFYDLADDGAIDVVDAGEVENEMLFVVEDVFLDVAVNLEAIVAHGDASGELDDDEAGLDLFLREFQESLLTAMRHDDGVMFADRVEATIARGVRQEEERCLRYEPKCRRDASTPPRARRTTAGKKKRARLRSG